MKQTDTPKPRDQSPAERAKQRLNAFREFQSALDYKMERINIMEQQLDSPSAPTLSDMPKGGSYDKDRFSGKIAQLVDLKNEYKAEVVKEREAYKAIQSISDSMEHADERAVIQLRYLDGAKWPEISSALYGRRDDYEEKAEIYLRRTFRKHGTALHSFGEAADRSGWWSK